MKKTACFALLLATTFCLATSSCSKNDEAVKSSDSDAPADVKVIPLAEVRMIRYAQMQERNGVVYEVNQEKPFTGVVVYKYRDGQKYAEIAFKDGKIHGLSTYWYPNGQKKAQIAYKDGKEHGEGISWYPNGQKEAQIAYKDGELHGLSTVWYLNGKKRAQATYKDGEVAP